MFFCVSDDTSLGNARIDLQKDLNILWSDIFPACGNDDILFSICNDEISFLVKATDIPGVKPPVFQNLIGSGFILKITEKHIVASCDDLTIFGQCYFTAGQSNPYSARNNLAGNGRAANTRAFRLSEQFNDVQSHCSEKAAHHSSEWSRSTPHELCPVQPHSFFYLAEDNLIGSIPLFLDLFRNILVAVPVYSGLFAHFESPIEKISLDSRSIGHFVQNGGSSPLVKTGH